MNKLAEES